LIFHKLVFSSILTTAFAFASTLTIPNNGSTVFFAETTGAPSAQVRSLGQTFSVPAPTTDNLLTEFDFFLAASTETGFDYEGYLFQWDAANTRAIGSALFQSTIRSGPGTAVFSGLTLLLNPALQYIALVTTQGVANNSFSSGLLNHNSTNAYLGGQAFQQNSAVAGSGGVGTWTTAAWSGVNGTTDFQFTAIFAPASSIPEPGTFVLAGIATAALAFVRRRRHQ
jgi:hypothetical protein